MVCPEHLSDWHALADRQDNEALVGNRRRACCDMESDTRHGMNKRHLCHRHSGGEDHDYQDDISAPLGSRVAACIHGSASTSAPRRQLKLLEREVNALLSSIEASPPLR